VVRVLNGAAKDHRRLSIAEFLIALHCIARDGRSIDERGKFLVDEISCPSVDAFGVDARRRID